MRGNPDVRTNWNGVRRCVPENPIPNVFVLTRFNILNDITSKILGDITMDVPNVPLHKYWGHVPLSHMDRSPWFWVQFTLKHA